ncbi:MAG: Sua5 family C-terminal domain-containing protein [Thiobacillaceae bacterium]
MRPGRITPEQLEAVLHRPLARRGEGVRAPGLLPAHYAPSTPIELVESAQLDARTASLAAAGLRIAVLERRGVATLPPGVERVAMPPAPDAYARTLYATLRDCDRQGFDRLLVERPPDAPDWLAVHDRLSRAARAFEAVPIPRPSLR